MDECPFFDRAMTTPKYRTTVSLTPKSRERLDCLVEETDRSIREIIQSGINQEYQEVVDK